MPTLAETLGGSRDPSPQQAMPSRLAQALMPIPERNERLRSFHAANRDLSMSPEEQNLYRLHLGNLYGTGGVDNPDGSRSTLYQTSVDINGKTYSLPTVWHGEIVPEDTAVNEALKFGLGHFPSYPSVAEAEGRYGEMHQYIDQDMDNYNQEQLRRALAMGRR
jgi:hypothetical protein